MAKTTAKRKTARPRRDSDLEQAARERRRLKALVQAKRDIARKVNELRRAIAASDAALNELADEVALRAGNALVARERIDEAERTAAGTV